MMPKFMIKKDFITIMFPIKEGGPKTVTSSENNYDIVKELLNNAFHKKVFNKILRTTFIRNKTGLELKKAIRIRINKLLQTSDWFSIRYPVLRFYYKELGYHTKRIREVIIRDAIRFYKDKTYFKDVSKLDRVLKNLLNILVDKKELINQTFKGTSVTIKDGKVYYKNEQLKENDLVDHIVTSIENGIDPQTYVNLDRKSVV